MVCQGVGSAQCCAPICDKVFLCTEFGADRVPWRSYARVHYSLSTFGYISHAITSEHGSTWAKQNSNKCFAQHRCLLGLLLRDEARRLG